jgi:hypothetical protein
MEGESVSTRIFHLIAMAWFSLVVPAAWADAPNAGASDQDSDGDAVAAPAAVASAQAAPADEERLKLFGFMPAHAAQPQPSPVPAGDETQAVAPAPQDQGLEGNELQPMPAPAAAVEEPVGQTPQAAEQASTPNGGEQAAAADAATTPEVQGGAEEATPAADAAVQEMTPTHAPGAEPHVPVHWSYSGAGAPQFWGDLKSGFSVCGTGMHQSPIDISTATITTLPELQIDYHDTPLRVVNNGHSIQVNYQQGSWVEVDGKRYELMQFHFHAPSEHTMGGKAYPMVATWCTGPPTVRCWSSPS